MRRYLPCIPDILKEVQIQQILTLLPRHHRHYIHISLISLIIRDDLGVDLLGVEVAEVDHYVMKGDVGCEIWSLCESRDVYYHLLVYGD